MGLLFFPAWWVGTGGAVPVDGVVCCWLVCGAGDGVARRVGGRDPCADVLRWHVCSVPRLLRRGAACSGRAEVRSVRRCRCIRRSRIVRVLRTCCWRRCLPSLSSICRRCGRDRCGAAGADRADVFHLHHLTPQHDAVRRCWPESAVVAHLHGTELKFLEALSERVALARSVGTTLAGMPEWARTNPASPRQRCASESCWGPRVGSNGSMARHGAIGCAARLTPPTIWWSCRPLTGTWRWSCWESMPSGSRTFPTGWTCSRSVHDR